MSRGRAGLNKAARFTIAMVGGGVFIWKFAPLAGTPNFVWGLIVAAAFGLLS